MHILFFYTLSYCNTFVCFVDELWIYKKTRKNWGELEKREEAVCAFVFAQSEENKEIFIIINQCSKSANNGEENEESRYVNRIKSYFFHHVWARARGCDGRIGWGVGQCAARIFRLVRVMEALSLRLGAFFVSKCSQLASIIRLDGRKNAEIEGIHVRLTRLCLVLIDYALAHWSFCGLE